MSTPVSEPLVERVSVSWRKGAIEPDGQIAAIGRAIDEQKIFIFRNVFPLEQVIELRRAFLSWGATEPEIPRGVSASQPGLNFHRVDDGTGPTTMPHIFRQFGIANETSLPGDLAKKIVAVGRPLLDLQNRLAGTGFSWESRVFRAKAIQHPRGGGFLVRHRHPYEPQKVSLFLNLSEPGRDYRSGAARFRSDAGGWIDTHEAFRAGDVLAWRYDLLHDVSAVDPESPLRWDTDDGFWIFAMEGVEVHRHSHTSET